MPALIALITFSLVLTLVYPDSGAIRHFEALSLFGSGESEFFTLTNGHAGPSTYQLLAFNGNKYGSAISYGQYTKGAFSLSGGVDLKLESDAGEITVAANIVAGSFYMMYLYSNEGQSTPQLAVYEFTKNAFSSAIDSGLATLFFTNLVRLRDVQIFINGVLFVDLPAPEQGKDPIIPQPLTLASSDFNAIIELYDTSNPNAKVLAVRGRVQLASKRVYVCHVMGDPKDQSAYPYTITMYKHSLSAALRLTGPSTIMHIVAIANKANLSPQHGVTVAAPGNGHVQTDTEIGLATHSCIRMKRFLWGKSRFSRADAIKIGGGAGDSNDAPFVNELHLGEYHLQLIDGSWQLMNAAMAAESLAASATGVEELKAEVRRLSQLTNDLQKQNHRLQFKNQILVAMCTISEGDRQIAEAENEQLLRSSSFVKVQPG